MKPIVLMGEIEDVSYMLVIMEYDLYSLKLHKYNRRALASDTRSGSLYFLHSRNIFLDI